MRKGRDGGKRGGKKNGGKKRKEKTDENSGHYVIASSRPLERQPMERRTLAPKVEKITNNMLQDTRPKLLLWTMDMEYPL